MIEEIMQALKIAIESEKMSFKKYLDFSLKNDDIRGKNIFIMLAQDEFNHYEYLGKMYRDKLVSNNYELESDFPSSVIEKLTPNLKKYEYDQNQNIFLKEEEVINVALKLENEAKLFYLDQFNKTSNPQVKSIWKRLADIEESHYQLLMSQTFYLRELTYWQNIKEISLEIGD